MKTKDFKNKKISMWRKLLLYMLAPVLVVSACIGVGLFLLGQFSTTAGTYSNNLSFQNEFYTRQIEKYFDDLSMMSEMLATDSSAIIDAYLKENGIGPDALDDSSVHTEGVQKALFSKLKEELLKADASGAFLLLDATVNTGVENAENSKTGLYFQRSTLDRTDETLLLFRGYAELGRENGVMPHRKWRLEFHLSAVPEAEDFFGKARRKTGTSILTDIFPIEGTSEKAIAILTPLYGAEGTFYGVCGFEISDKYFKDTFAQTTRFEHLTCTFSKTNENGSIDCENIFWAGVRGGYSLKPSGTLTPKKMSGDLTEFDGESKFVAVKNEVTVCDTDYTLAVMQPKSEFDRTLAINVTRILSVCALLVFTAVALCVIFSRRFVAPVIKSLDRIRRQERAETDSDIIEIDDLFLYLAEQDRLRDLETDRLKRQNDELACVTETQTVEIDRHRAEIERLAYSRKSEIDPYDYEAFRIGLKELTKTEKTVFDLYLQGKTAKEIVCLLDIRESTLKFHNHNILEKLGVSSRKQMLRYATLLKQESGD